MRWLVLLVAIVLTILACAPPPSLNRVYTQDGWYEFREIEPVETCCPKRTAEMCPVCDHKLVFAKEKGSKDETLTSLPPIVKTVRYRYVCPNCHKQWEIVHTKVSR